IRSGPPLLVKVPTLQKTPGPSWLGGTVIVVPPAVISSATGLTYCSETVQRPAGSRADATALSPGAIWRKPNSPVLSSPPSGARVWRARREHEPEAIELVGDDAVEVVRPRDAPRLLAPRRERHLRRRYVAVRVADLDAAQDPRDVVVLAHVQRRPARQQRTQR